MTMPIGPFHHSYPNTVKKEVSLMIATWYIRTLLDADKDFDRPQRRMAPIATELKCYNVDIGALSKMCLLGEGSLCEVEGGYTFYWRGYPLQLATLT